MAYTGPEYHNFKVEFAFLVLPDGKMVGTDNAIFLQDIAYWCDYNKSSGANFHDGRYWTYSTMDAIAERHPYWTKKQVRRIIDRCKEIGFLLVGNYNKSSYDRTIWYSVSDEVINILGFSKEEIPSAHMGKWKLPDGQNQNSKQADGSFQMGTPIPNIKKNNNTDTKQIFNSFIELGFGENLINAVKDWIIYKKEKGETYKATGLKRFLGEVRNNVQKYGEQNVIEVINQSMASNYTGVIFNRLSQNEYNRSPKYQNPNRNIFAEILREEYGESG